MESKRVISDQAVMLVCLETSTRRSSESRAMMCIAARLSCLGYAAWKVAKSGHLSSPYCHHYLSEGAGESTMLRRTTA